MKHIDRALAWEADPANSGTLRPLYIYIALCKAHMIDMTPNSAGIARGERLNRRGDLAVEALRQS